MKKIICLIIITALLFCLTACRTLSPADVDNAVIDYGNSEIYSKDDMDAAIKLIKEEFSGWDGCVLKTISYGSDEKCSESELEWLKELEATRKTSENYSQCIMFNTDFYSPEYDDPDYTDFFQWWLVRSDGGEWVLIEWGHP